MSLDLRAHFSTFRDAVPERVHLAAHSHHFWPDAACAAHGKALTDAAALADRKWGPVFEELLPRVRRGIAGILTLPKPATIAFAPNTHELLCRLISALALDHPARVLTSDSEFHSFQRQMARLEEEGLVRVERVPGTPCATFQERFCAAAASRPHDLVFVSQVFFNSGASAGDLAAIVSAVSSIDAFVVIDGYHGFMALPTDFSALAARAFYLAGGYKYAMAGEGACFMHCPPGYAPRPRDTGWFAEFSALEAAPGSGVSYGADGSRFLGATFDPTGLYRLAAVFDWMDGIGLSVQAIHDHVLNLQILFLEGVQRLDIRALLDARLITPITAYRRGHFLTYETAQARAIHDRLAAAGIITDVRGERIRFGFGCYHADEDITCAAEAIARALSPS
jgi:selenocysteine lyase/cysteine desulfurase